MDQFLLEPNGCLLAILPLLPSQVTSLITSISTQFTTEAFPVLTPFETIFVGFALIQIFIFQLLGLIPFNLNNVLNGEHGGGFMKGRRKRRGAVFNETCHDAKEQMEVIQKVFETVKKLDKYDCILRALCEAQGKASVGHKLPPGISRSLEGLKAISKSTDQDVTSTESPGLSGHVPSPVQAFAEASKVGSLTRPGKNSSCSQYYSLCPVSTDSVLAYILDLTPILDGFL